MKDIDFDELDKAVNSLMGRNAQKGVTDAPETPPVKEPDMPLTAAPVSPGVIRPKSEVATNPDTQPAIVPSPSKPPVSFPPRSGAPASRRSGRFMDVVPKKPTSTTGSAPREGVTITPRSDMASSAASTSTLPVQPTPPVQPESKPSITTETNAPVSDWPDPIEMHAMKNADTSAATSTSPLSDTPAPAEKQSDEPLSSPFLPDTKVEKRPLGGASPMVPMVAPEHELQAAAPDDSEAQLPAKPSDVKPETPEEFRGDLMQVEADTHMGMPKTDQTHPMEDKDEPEIQKPASEQPMQKEAENKEAVPAPKETESPSESNETTPESHVGRISIPQQYKEQPSSGEKESGAIYDTDTYHQPLAHPAKKKSGWLWVLWIVLILIVGAGVGVALYFLGIM